MVKNMMNGGFHRVAGVRTVLGKNLHELAGTRPKSRTVQRLNPKLSWLRESPFWPVRNISFIISSHLICLSIALILRPLNPTFTRIASLVVSPESWQVNRS